MITKSKAHKRFKAAFYSWSYGGSCLSYLQKHNLSKRRFKKWFFKRLLNISYKTKDGNLSGLSKEYIVKTWYHNIKHLG